MNEDRIFGAFEDVEKTIRECVKGIENITVISGFDFVPKDEKYYADLRLHPNDDGFESYAEHLYNAISIELWYILIQRRFLFYFARVRSNDLIW